MSAANTPNKKDIDNALRSTTKELRQAQKYSNNAFNLARRKVVEIQKQIASTPDQTFAVPAAPAAASGKSRPTSKQAKRRTDKKKKPMQDTPAPKAAAASAPAPKAAAASAPKPKAKTKTPSSPNFYVNPDSDISGSSSDEEERKIFYASTGMTPEVKKNMDKTFKAMDEVSPGLSDGLDDEGPSKTPVNTPAQTKATDDDFVLVQSSAKRKSKLPPRIDGASAKRHKKSPGAKRKTTVPPAASGNPAAASGTPHKKTKDCPSCGAKIAVACRKCPHCGASALKQDPRSKRERQRRRERAEAAATTDNKHIQTDSGKI